MDLSGLLGTAGEAGLTAGVADSGAFDFTRVTTLEIRLNGSGAIDNLFFDRLIPTPGTALPVAAVGVLVAGRRRRVASVRTG